MIVKQFTTSRPALSMIELVLVIVILGIVASIGASAIANVYESYIVQRAVHRASNKSELAAMQIANRLAFRISSSVIGKKAGGYLPLDQVPDGTYTTLEWIGYDNDSFAAQLAPNWSGYCDVNASTKTNISTPGSLLNGTIITNLGGSIATGAIIFAGHEYNQSKNYIANCMGFTDSTCISPISGVAANSITVTDNNPKVITDQYKLAWSAYALVPSGNELILYYDYQPWNGDSYTDGSSSVIVDKFVSFRFKGDGDTVRFKLCIEEEIASDANVTICKEKAVIR